MEADEFRNSTPSTATATKIIIDPMLQMYVGVGAGAILTNLFILVVVLSDRAYLRKAGFIFGYAGGNLFNGLAHFVSGIARISYTLDGTLTTFVSTWQCMASTFPSLFLLGSELPSVLLVVMSLERFAAIVTPNWYHNHWKSRKNWYVAAMVYLFVIISISVVWFNTGLASSPTMVPRYCTAPSVVGLSYTLYYYGLSIFGGTFSCIVTITAMIIGQCRLRKAQQFTGSAGEARTRKQMRLTRTLLIITFADSGLVVVPNIFLFSYNTTRAQISQIQLASGYASATYCINSMLVVLLYLIFNGDFRGVALKLVCFRACLKNTAPATTIQQPLGNMVHPVSNTHLTEM